MQLFPGYCQVTMPAPHKMPASLGKYNAKQQKKKGNGRNELVLCFYHPPQSLRKPGTAFPLPALRLALPPELVSTVPSIGCLIHSLPRNGALQSLMQQNLVSGTTNVYIKHVAQPSVMNVSLKSSHCARPRSHSQVNRCLQLLQLKGCGIPRTLRKYQLLQAHDHSSRARKVLIKTWMERHEKR